MEISVDLQEKFLFFGSPFIQPVFEDSLERISKSIVEKRSWPQDAVVMELLAGGNPLLRIPFGDTFETFRKKGIIIHPTSFGEILKGYVLPLTTINIAVRTFQDGEGKTTEYLNKSPGDLDKVFFTRNLAKLGKLFADDNSCKPIFRFVREKYSSSSDFHSLGVEISMNTFVIYLETIRQQMNEAFGVAVTSRMFSGH